MGPTATAQGDPKAAARKRNVQRAEQRIQSGRAYTQASMRTLARAGVNIGALLDRTPDRGLPGAQAGAAQQQMFQTTLHKQVAEHNHQVQLQALRHALTLIKQHRAQRPAPQSYATPPR